MIRPSRDPMLLQWDGKRPGCRDMPMRLRTRLRLWIKVRVWYTFDEWGRVTVDLFSVPIPGWLWRWINRQDYD